MRRRAALLIVVLAALLAPAGSASAARPLLRGHYVDTDFVLSADLRVAPSGRTFVPKRSRLDYFGNDCTTHVFIGRAGHRVHIARRTGAFAYVTRHEGLRVRVKGRFTTRRKADLSFRWKRLKGAPHTCDAKGGDTLAPRRTGPVPFKGCQAEKRHDILATPSGKVWDEERWYGGDGWQSAAFACGYAANTRVLLGEDNDDDSDFGPFALSGGFVAYGRADCPMGCSFSVGVKDLATGRRLHLDQGFENGFGEVSVIVVKANGSVAWTSEAPFESPLPEPASLWVHDTNGLRRLDAGAGIDLKSLTLSGSTLTWTSGGVTRTAPID